MIISGDSTPASIGTTVIRVRPLELDEVKRLEPSELIYVQDKGFKSRVLTPAYRKAGSGYYMEQDENPRLHVRSIYGSEFWVSAKNDVFEQDDLGEEVDMIRSVGSRVSSSVFIPGVEPEEAEARLKKALRDEFGPGIVELWNLRSKPTRDLRWDVYQVKNGWVPRGNDRRGRSQGGSVQEVERKLIARGVRDGHQHHFTGKAEPGWQVVSEPHQPHTAETEVL